MFAGDDDSLEAFEAGPDEELTRFYLEEAFETENSSTRDRPGAIAEGAAARDE